MSRRVLVLIPLLAACQSAEPPATEPGDDGSPKTTRPMRPTAFGPGHATPTPWTPDAVSELIDEDMVLVMPEDHDGDGVPTPIDCNDSDDRIYPGAVESCDNVDRNCDGLAFAPASITFLHDDGTFESVDEDFAAGAPGAPVHVVLDEPGALLVCPSTVHATVEIRADVMLHALGSARNTTIDAGGAGPVVEVVGEGLTVQVSRLALVGGSAASGGGLSCAGPNRVGLWDAALVDNQAERGGGLYSDGCDVSATNTHVWANQADEAGGGMAIDGGTLQMNGSTVVANHSGAGGGGIELDATQGPVQADMSDTLFADNTAATDGGGLRLSAHSKYTVEAHLRCSTLGEGGFVGNRAEAGSHLGIDRTASGDAQITMSHCFLDEDQEAGQAVVRSDRGDKIYRSLDGQSLACTTTACR